MLLSTGMTVFKVESKQGDGINSMHGKKEGKRLTRERYDLRMVCLPPHVLTYILQLYHGSLHLVLQFLAEIHDMPNPNEFIHYLEAFLTRSGSQLSHFHNSVSILLILWFTKHGQLLPKHCKSHELHRYLPPPKSWNPSHGIPYGKT